MTQTLPLNPINSNVDAQIAFTPEEQKLQSESQTLNVAVSNEIHPIKGKSVEMPRSRPALPQGLKLDFNIILGQDGHAYAVISKSGNNEVIRINSRKFETIVYALANKQGLTLSSFQIKGIAEQLTAFVEIQGETAYVWNRVAPYENGIEIDCGNFRIIVLPSKVKVDQKGSPNLFYKNPVSLPMVRPAPIGDIHLLKNYVNLSYTDIVLLIAWISYTLAHPKKKTSKFPILVINSNKGSGKSFLCLNIILNLIDPNIVGLQVFPCDVKDFGISVQHSHVVCFDNIRYFSHKMSDALCIGSTGGSFSSRALYTNDVQHVQTLHGAVILNGIHKFINEPDLAERCLIIRPMKIPENQRRSEEEMIENLEKDLPIIFRGVLDLIANIFEKLPEAKAKITYPQRMLDFAHWLTAMEMVDGVEIGTYQAAYAEVINESQLDSLLDNLLGAAIIDFTNDDLMKTNKWSGTPSRLLSHLNNFVPLNTQRSKEWPSNPIALSKRLNSLKDTLLGQGICIEFSRGKNRIISIEVLNQPNRSATKSTTNLDEDWPKLDDTTNNYVRIQRGEDAF